MAERNAKTLFEFLRYERKAILELWTERARKSLDPARHLTTLALLDHMPTILDQLVAPPGGDEPVHPTLGVRIHATDRLALGFDLREIVREYALLRECVLEVFERTATTTLDSAELRRLNRAIDRAIEISAGHFIELRERLFAALDRVTQQTPAPKTIDPLLKHLLETCIEFLESADAAVVFARRRDAQGTLDVHASAGFAEGFDFSIAMGEGVVGKVAAGLRPMLVPDASRDPVLQSPDMLKSGLRALYAVPLSHEARAIGVLLVGSKTAFDFSEDEKLLFDVVANRVAHVIMEAGVVAERERANAERDALLEEKRLLRREYERATHELTGRNLEFQALADSIPQLTWIADEAGGRIWFNRRWLEFTGLSLEQARGWGWQQAVHPDHLEHVLKRVRHSLDVGEAWEDTFPLRGADGEYRWFLGRAVPIFDAGRIVRWFGTKTDVTELREREQALAEVEARMRLVSEATGLGTWDIDLKTGAAIWSPEMKDVFGVPGAFDPSMGWSRKHIHEDDREAVDQTLEHAYDPAGDGRFRIEYRIHRVVDSELRWVSVRGRVLFDEERRPSRMLGTVLDVSDRKRAEAAQNFLAEATAVLASSLDYQGNLERISKMVVRELADCCVIELVGRDGALEPSVVADVDPARVERTREVCRHPPRFVDAAMEPIVSSEWLPGLELGSSMIVPMRARNEILGIITLGSRSGWRYRDDDLRMAKSLAQRAALAIDNARLYRDAEDAKYRREQTLAAVSHDLKNPLTTVNTSTALLGRQLGTVDERAKRHLESIQRASQRMQRLIEDLLDVASIDAGRLTVEPRAEVLGPLLDEVLDSHRVQAEMKGITLRAEVECEPTLQIRADKQRLLQVFGNLVGNALKFCRREESITLGAKLRGECVMFSVRDTGPGIPADEIARIFDPYWSARRHAGKGTGLGLAISKGIVEAHGGKLWAESEVGVGTTFFFTVPLWRA